MKTIHAVFQNDGEWFIARCLDVPVTTQGKTLAAAKKNLREAVELYLETWGGRKGFKPAKEVYLTSMEVNA
jgi:predicted RNase H-like HicB family nuclease